MAFAAKVLTVMLAVPWHIDEAEGTGVEGVPTTGVTTTVPLAHDVVLQAPEART